MMKSKAFKPMLAVLMLCCVLGFFTLTSAAAGSLMNFEYTDIYDGRFADLDEGKWYYLDVVTSFETGIVNGVSDTAFQPAGNVTVAQAITIASRIHAIYYGNTIDTANSSPWYQCYVDYAEENEIISRNLFAREDFALDATRFQVADIFTNILPEEEMEAINRVDDDAIPDVSGSSAYAKSVYMLYRCGIMIGDGSYNFNGSTPITRAEITAVSMRLIKMTDRKTVKLISDQFSSVIYKNKSVKLGSKEAAVTVPLGEPDEKLRSIYGYTWYVYGTEDYKSLFMAGIYQGEIVMLYAAGEGFRYGQVTMGSECPEGVPGIHNDTVVEVSADAKDYTVFQVLLRKLQWEDIFTLTEETLQNEARLLGYMTNVYRVSKGLEPLQIIDAASAEAKNHCISMADNSYAASEDPTGTSVAERLAKAGISASEADSTVLGGYYSAVDCHATNVNYKEYNEIITGDWKKMGCGGYFLNGSMYRTYFETIYYK